MTKHRAQRPTRRRSKYPASLFSWFKDDFDKAGGVKNILVKYAPEQYQDPTAYQWLALACFIFRNAELGILYIS
jgi:hypothetical protein